MILDVEKNTVGNRFRQEYTDNLATEMDKFSGKVATGDDDNKS